jgi:type II secretion system protein J
VKGFTLLEVLIALGITVLMTTAIYTAYTGNLEAIEQVQDQEVVFQTARVVLDRMARDLEAAVIDSVSGVTPEGKLALVGTAGVMGGLSADRVELTTFSHLDWREGAPRTDLCEVGYRLERDEDTEEIVLFRRQQILPDGDPEEGGERVPLSEDVRSLEIRYEYPAGREMDAWDSRTGDQEGLLPRTIRLRLTVRGLSGSEAVFTTRVHPALFTREETE